MRRFDRLVAEYPEQYQLVEQTEVSKTYFMSKSYVSYRKPRKVSDDQREKARSKMEAINQAKNSVI